MLVKSADDKSKRLQLLDSLQSAPLLSAQQRDWLRKEYWNVRNGIEGERDAAHYIDRHLHGGENHVVLHDLRLVDEGDVAQIDHLIIGRGFIFYLLETKSFSGNLQINDQGEFTVDYGKGHRFGIPSPIEQSKRHEAVLLRVLERLGIAGRTQEKPLIKHAVLIHPKGIITRPDPKRFDTSDVIKADQFGTWRERFVDKGLGVGKVLTAMLNLRSLDTIAEWGQMLKRQHRPQDLLALPDFMKPRQGAPAPEAQRAAPTPRAQGPSEVPADDPKKRLICATCGSKISYAEGQYCWNRAARFGGLQYCRAHQQDIAG